MIALENADEIQRILDRFTEQKATEIPPELGAYIKHVAKTGDTIYRWSTIQYLFREKIKTVIKEFQDTSTSIKGAHWTFPNLLLRALFFLCVCCLHPFLSLSLLLLCTYKYTIVCLWPYLHLILLLPNWNLRRIYANGLHFVM